MFEVVYNKKNKNLSLIRIESLEKEGKYIQVAQTSRNKHPIYVSSLTLDLYKKKTDECSRKTFIYLFFLLLFFSLLFIILKIFNKKRKRRKYADLISNGFHEVFWKTSASVPKNTTNVSLHPY